MKKQFQVYKLIIVMAVFIALLVAARIKLSNSIQYIFLIWNLFLAWIPFELSRHVAIKNKKYVNGILFCIWLLFFPNALYIITDLIHIRNYGHAAVPVWYDAVLIFSSSLFGLFFAFASLKNIEEFMQQFVAKKWVSISMATILLLGSFGVYLGRFQRWNSWDIIRNPSGLALNIFDRIINPFEHVRTWAVTFILFGLFSIIYFFAKNITIKNRHLEN